MNRLGNALEYCNKRKQEMKDKVDNNPVIHSTGAEGNPFTSITGIVDKEALLGDPTMGTLIEMTNKYYRSGKSDMNSTNYYYVLKANKDNNKTACSQYYLEAVEVSPLFNTVSEIRIRKDSTCFKDLIEITLDEYDKIEEEVSFRNTQQGHLESFSKETQKIKNKIAKKTTINKLAAKAMQGLVSRFGINKLFTAEDVASVSYNVAIAMYKEMEERGYGENTH